MSAALLVLSLLACGDKADEDDDDGDGGGSMDGGAGDGGSQDGGAGDGGAGDGGAGDGGAGDGGGSADGGSDGGGGSGDGGSDGGAGDGGSGDGGGTGLSSWVDVSTLPHGDVSCFAGTWLSRSIDSRCVVSEDTDGVVRDSQTGESVADARVLVYLDDVRDESPNSESTASEFGQFSVWFQRCQAISIEVSTDPFLEMAVPTLAPHLFQEPGDPSIALDAVSVETRAILLALFGLEDVPALGMVMGRIRDCRGIPLGGAQVVYRAADGHLPEVQETGYFVKEFPEPVMDFSSVDGLFLIANLPPGRGRVEVYVGDGSGPVEVAGIVVDVLAGGVTLADAHVGWPDGVVPPEVCESCP